MPIKDSVKIDARISEISCNGGDVSGHPLVYYSFDGRDELTCKYCGKHFTKLDKNKKSA